MFPERPVCTRCGKSPTYEWIQLTSLLVIFLAVMGNEVTGWFLLPKNGGDASLGTFLQDLALGGSPDKRVWLDAAGRSAADVGVLRMAQSAEGETRDEDPQLG
jgi:hypothetical protein